MTTHLEIRDADGGSIILAPWTGPEGGYALWHKGVLVWKSADPVPAPEKPAAPAVRELPSWWRLCGKTAQALAKYRDIKADLADFDGDRRGIAAAMISAEFRVLAAICADHEHADDDEDRNGAFVGPMVALMDRMIAQPIPTLAGEKTDD